MGTIEKDILYCITQVSSKNYLGRTLTTSKLSVVAVHKLSKDFPILDEVVFKR